MAPPKTFIPTEKSRRWVEISDGFPLRAHSDHQKGQAEGCARSVNPRLPLHDSGKPAGGECALGDLNQARRRLAFLEFPVLCAVFRHVG